MKPRILASILLGCMLAMPVFAEEPSTPYAGQQMRSIKALSDQDNAGLLGGEGMGMAKAAELNGYPGPIHVLALAKELRLSARQRRQMEAIMDRMKGLRNLSALIWSSASGCSTGYSQGMKSLPTVLPLRQPR